MPGFGQKKIIDLKSEASDPGVLVFPLHETIPESASGILPANELAWTGEMQPLNQSGPWTCCGWSCFVIICQGCLDPWTTYKRLQRLEKNEQVLIDFWFSSLRAETSVPARIWITKVRKPLWIHLIWNLLKPAVQAVESYLIPPAPFSKFLTVSDFIYTISIYYTCRIAVEEMSHNEFYPKLVAWLFEHEDILLHCTQCWVMLRVSRTSSFLCVQTSAVLASNPKVKYTWRFFLKEKARLARKEWNAMLKYSSHWQLWKFSSKLERVLLTISTKFILWNLLCLGLGKKSQVYSGENILSSIPRLRAHGKYVLDTLKKIVILTNLIMMKIGNHWAITRINKNSYYNNKDSIQTSVRYFGTSMRLGMKA